MPNNELLELEIPQFEKVKSGKVREVFDMGESYLFVASDRVSAFDVVLPNGIPRKGEVLTQISHFWFDRFENDIPNYRIKDGLPEDLAHLVRAEMCFYFLSKLRAATVALSTFPRVLDWLSGSGRLVGCISKYSGT